MDRNEAATPESELKPTPPSASLVTMRQRMRDARRSLIVALLCILTAAAALWFGEHTELERVRSLREGRDDATVVANDMVRPELEGKLIHVAGTLSAHDLLRDDSLGVAVEGLRLHRTVEMFQWEEHEEDVVAPGSSEKKRVKSYVKSWASALVVSRSFEPGHDNPSEPPFVDRVLTAERASLGPFLLNADGVRQLSNFEPLPPTQEMVDRAPADVKSRLRLTGQSLYLGRDPSQPEIGDCRIALQIVKNQPVSILAEQHGAELTVHKTRAGGEVFVVRAGSSDAGALLEAVDVGTSSATWMARAAGLVLLGFGLTLLLAAFGAGGRAAPRTGRFVLPGLALLGLSSAALIGGAAIGSAWVGEKPVVGGVAFAVATAGMVGAVLLVTRARRQRRS